MSRLLSLTLAICRSFLDNMPYRNNFRFPFSSLLTLYLSLLHKTRVAMRFPAKITWSCHTCMLIELFYIGMPVVRADGRSGGRTGRCTVTWLPKFLGCIGYQILIPMVLRFARERAPLLSEFITEMILTIRTDEPNIYRTYSYRDNQICFSFFRRFWRYGNYQQSIKQPSRDQEAISELPQTSVSKRGEVRGRWYGNDFLFFCK